MHVIEDDAELESCLAWKGKKNQIGINEVGE